MNRMQICLSGFLLLVFLGVNDIRAQTATDAVERVDTVKSNQFSLLASFGAGLIRNDLSPTVHINIGYKHRERYEVTAATSSYFFFGTTDAGKHSIYRNTFAGLEFMLNFSPFSKEDPNWNGLGISYLIEKRGEFFTEPAGMIYYKRKFRNFSIMPGIVLDDNLKDVWPQITIRL